MDWALEAEAGACIGLLVRCARARGVGAGTGEVAPLSTSTEHFHGCTNAEMQLRLAEVAAEAAGRLAKAEAREAVPLPGGVEETHFTVDADALRARLAASRAIAEAAVAAM